MTPFRQIRIYESTSVPLAFECELKFALAPYKIYKRLHQYIVVHYSIMVLPGLDFEIQRQTRIMSLVASYQQLRTETKSGYVNAKAFYKNRLLDERGNERKEID